MSEIRHERTILQQRDLKLRAATYIVTILITILVLSPFVIWLTTAGYEQETSELQKFLKDPLKRVLRYWKQTVDFCESSLFVSLGNSAIVTGSTCVGCMYISALTAYGLTAYEWKFRKAVSTFIIIVMMLPPTVSYIGYYKMVQDLHLINNLAMVILPAVASPITVFFMKMYLQATFSKELVESARIDGAGEFRIFNQLILPMLKPAVATQLIFCFSQSWYDTYLPSILLIKDEFRTYAVAYNIYIIKPIVITVAPPIIVYLFCARHIVEGVALGSVKQ
ncbi:MAG: carbohydrate ABC transporter permease [Clostridiales bacterium]|nr:carbohydrate ABC transporter permease [Clostridiales bacterium]